MWRGVLFLAWGAGGKGDPGAEHHRPGSSVPAAQNVTVDEVISAYKQACQKLNCRQIPKLLRQLQVPGRGRVHSERGGGGERRFLNHPPPLRCRSPQAFP